MRHSIQVSVSSKVRIPRDLKIELRQSVMKVASIIMCYKMLNNLVDLDCSDFCMLANSNRTRGHSCKLFTQQCSLDVRKYCFANRVVEPCTHLPDHIVRASSVSLFRKLIDTVDLSGYCRY